MTQLSDFPPDVQAAAKAAYDAYRFGTDYGIVEAFALAINAERERLTRQPKRIGGLTAHQKRVLEYLTAYAAQHGIAPSYEEIRVFLGIASKSGVHRVIHELAERGAIEHRKDRSRAITIISTPAS